MQAGSIIRLLDYCQVDYSGRPFSAQRARKLINAEFALSEDGMLTLDSIVYNKGEVLQELEQPDIELRLEQHQLVWKHKSLLDLLERDRLDLEDAQYSWLNLQYREGFTAFISSYMAPAFNSVMKSLLKRSDMYNAYVWTSFSAFIVPEDEERAYEGLRIFLEDNLRMFRNLNEETFRQRRGDLQVWVSQDWHLLFNYLPDALFHYNDEYAHQLINFTVMIQKIDKPMCVGISWHLTQLQHVSYNYQKLIHDNHAIYTSSPIASPVSRKKTGWPQGVWIGLMVIFALVRVLANTDSCSSKRTSFGDAQIIPLENADPLMIPDGDTLQSAKALDIPELRRVFSARVFSKSGISITADALKTSPFKPNTIYMVFSPGRQKDMLPAKLYNNSGRYITLYLPGNWNHGMQLAPGRIIDLQQQNQGDAELFIDLGSTYRENLQMLNGQSVLLSDRKTTADSFHFTNESAITLGAQKVIDREQFFSSRVTITINRIEETFYLDIAGAGQLSYINFYNDSHNNDE